MSTYSQNNERREPQVVAAGDTIVWWRQCNDYSPSEWTLHYIIRNEKNIYKFDATNDGGVFKVEVPSAVSALWVPGKYLIGAWVTNTNSEQHQVLTTFPNLVVGPNLAADPNGGNPISWAAQCLAAIQNTILALTSKQVASASVNGNAYTLENIGDLFKLRERFKSEVAREEAQERLNAGLGAGNKVAIRFKSLQQQPWRPGQWWPPWQ